MARIALIGDATSAALFGLAGAVVYRADHPDQATDAWRRLPEDVAVVLLAGPAATTLPDTFGGTAPDGRPLVVAVLP